MTRPDPYQPTGPTRPPAGPPPYGTRTGNVRTLLWILLVLSVVGNMVASYAGGALAAHLACGVVTGLCAIVLVVQRLGVRR